MFGVALTAPSVSDVCALGPSNFYFSVGNSPYL